MDLHQQKINKHLVLIENLQIPSFFKHEFDKQKIDFQRLRSKVKRAKNKDKS